MWTVTVTTKGRVTIPKEVRERLRIETGDRLSLVPRQDGSILMRLITSHVRELGGLLHRREQRIVSIQGMNEGIARQALAKFGRRR